jgi:hypothetical protein
VARHKFVKDWWGAYARRKALHNGEFVRQIAQRKYDVIEHDIIEKYDELRLAKGQPSLNIPVRYVTHQIGSALVDEEIHLKCAHHNLDGFLGSYTLDCAHCLICEKRLPLVACFLRGHYYCLECIRKWILPVFCSARLAPVREAGLITNDLVETIARFMCRLSFDHDQILCLDTAKYLMWFVYMPPALEMDRVSTLQLALLTY